MPLDRKEFENWRKTVLKDPLFEELCIERNVAKQTIKKYRISLTSYCMYNQMNLTELFKEADEEEENGIRAKRRKIIKRLKGFRLWLINNDLTKLSVTTRFEDVKIFYRQNGIEIPYIPRIALKNENQETYYDIPRIEHVKKAVETTNMLNSKALFLFCASSGTGRKEASEIRIKDFIKATKKYHNESEIQKVIKKLDNNKDVVPLFELIRFKTNYKYFTCCSPEASQAIVDLLKTKKKINSNDRVFYLKEDSISQAFKRINEKLNWGKKGTYNFFGCHKLRKFNASALTDKDLVNSIQGRKRSLVYESYFKDNPERIREEYIKHLDEITINKTIVNVIDDEATKKLKAEIESKDKEIEEIKKQQEMILEMLKERDIK